MYAQPFFEFWAGFPSVKFLMIWAGVSVRWVLMRLTENTPAAERRLGCCRGLWVIRLQMSATQKKQNRRPGIGIGCACVCVCVCVSIRVCVVKINTFYSASQKHTLICNIEMTTSQTSPKSATHLSERTNTHKEPCKINIVLLLLHCDEPIRQSKTLIQLSASLCICSYCIIWIKATLTVIKTC